MTFSCPIFSTLLINPTIWSPGFSYWSIIERFYKQPAISDINFNSDLQENSAMSDLINYLHTTGGVPVTSDNEYSVGVMWLLIKWLVWQLKVHLQVVNYFLLTNEYFPQIFKSTDMEYTSISTTLQDIINRIDCSNLISRAFFSMYFLHGTSTQSLSPFGINPVNNCSQVVIWAVELYPYILLLSRSNSYSPLKEDVI